MERENSKKNYFYRPQPGRNKQKCRNGKRMINTQRDGKTMVTNMILSSFLMAKEVVTLR